MMEPWGGAQWVLITLMVLNVAMPLLVRIGGLCTSEKTLPQWIGWFIGRIINTAGLAIILAWGGFWA